MKALTQQDLAFQDGYIERFEFVEGQFQRLLQPGVLYQIITLEKKPYPCPITKTIVYRIQTKDGIKGVAVLNFEVDDESFHLFFKA